MYISNTWKLFNNIRIGMSGPTIFRVLTIHFGPDSNLFQVISDLICTLTCFRAQFKLKVDLTQVQSVPCSSKHVNVNHDRTRIPEFRQKLASACIIELPWKVISVFSLKSKDQVPLKRSKNYHNLVYHRAVMSSCISSLQHFIKRDTVEPGSSASVSK